MKNRSVKKQTPKNTFKKELPTYGSGGKHKGAWTGAATGAVSGASTGMAAGPWGALVGAVVGAGVGALQGDQQDKENAELQKQQHEQEIQMRKDNSQFMYGPKFNQPSQSDYNLQSNYGYRSYNQQVFANGGMNMVPNAEVESRENIVAPNGGFLQVDGPTHENGGVPVNIPQGAKVFSDRLKMPGTKKTFAELNKPNNTNKEDKILSSNKHGNISKHTAELMKLAKNKNSDNIFAAQEALKQAKVEAYAKKLGVTLPQTDNQTPQEFAYGGKMLPKYPGGGYFDEITGQWVENTGNPSFEEEDPKVTYAKQRYQAMTDKAPMQNISIPLGKESYNPQDLELKGNPEIKEIPQYIPNKYDKSAESSKINWNKIGSNIAMGLANNAGNIYNLSRYNKPEIERYERLKATLLDPTAAMRDAEAEARRAEYNVRGASGGNAGTYLSNRVALNAQNVVNKDRIRKDYANAYAGISNSVAQYNNQLAMQEVIANAQNRARTRSGKGEAIGSMGSNIANQMMDNKKGAMDQKTLGLLLQYYNTPEFQKLMKEYNA